MRPPAVLAIHGGAGPAPVDDGTGADAGAGGAAARWARQSAGLAEALRVGLAVLGDGGEALEAVVAAVTVLEDDDQWNAGRGSDRIRAHPTERRKRGACRSGDP